MTRCTNVLVWTKLLVATSAPLCFADQILEGYSVISGKEFAFEVKAPVGWVLDNEAARQQGLNLVFYPTGTNWQTSKVVIYVRVRSNDAIPGAGLSRRRAVACVTLLSASHRTPAVAPNAC